MFVSILWYNCNIKILSENADKEGVKSQLQTIIDDILEQNIRDYVLFYDLRNRQFRADFKEEFG
jgi:hypothetical protein